MVKHTWPDHDDYKHLAEALVKIGEVADYINERKRESESINKIVEIQKKLTGEFEVNIL
jgi:hypothetical protein